MARVRPMIASVTAWIFGVAAAVAVALFALSSIGDGFSGKPIVPVADGGNGAPAGTATDTPGEPTTGPTTGPTTNQPPAGQPPTGTGPTTSAGRPVPTTTSPPPTSAGDRKLTTTGGDITARCVPGGAYLVYWTPAQGYHATDVFRGPASTAHLVFENQLHYRVDVTCTGGVPRATERIISDN